MDIEDYRRVIDDIDEGIIDLISKRGEVVKSIGNYKKKHGIDALDPDRKQKVLNKWQAIARKKDLDPEMVGKIYEILHEMALSIEE